MLISKGFNRRKARKGEASAFIDAALDPGHDECVIWPFAVCPRGYARGGNGKRTFTVCNEVCKRVHGDPPTPKLDAAHSCNNGRLGCVNGRHIFWKTRAENEADKLLCGRSNRGERCGTSKLTQEQVTFIRKSSLLQRELGEMFGVTQQMVSRIKCGNRWAWLTEGDEDGKKG